MLILRHPNQFLLPTGRHNEPAHRTPKNLLERISLYRSFLLPKPCSMRIQRRGPRCSKASMGVNTAQAI